MAIDFSTITDQAALDAAIEQERADAIRAYEGYVSPADHSAALQTVQDQLATATARVEQYELAERRLQAARDAGIPDSFAARLSGNTAEELNADAAQLKTLLDATSSNHQPGRSTEPAAKKSTTPDSLRDMLGDLAKGLSL